MKKSEIDLNDIGKCGVLILSKEASQRLIEAFHTIPDKKLAMEALRMLKKCECKGAKRKLIIERLLSLPPLNLVY